MARILILVMVLAACAAIAAIIYGIWTALSAAAERGMRPVLTQTAEGEMAPTGIQKAAYIALIVVLFGVASGWLGGL